MLCSHFSKHSIYSLKQQEKFLISLDSNKIFCYIDVVQK
nr:MAG TPA_asm: hypothetical protein [Caudoviricetes sp.]